MVSVCPGEPGFKCSNGGIYAKGLCGNCYQRQWYRANPEGSRARSRLYREANPEKVAEGRRRHYEANTEKIAASTRRYYESNAEQISEYQRRYYESNREKVLERGNRWRKANPDKLAVYARRRRARQRQALAIPFTPVQLDARMAYWGLRCWMCGVPSREVDHVIPLALGGSHVLANLRPACRSCNASKGARRLSSLSKGVF